MPAYFVFFGVSLGYLMSVSSIMRHSIQVLPADCGVHKIRYQQVQHLQLQNVSWRLHRQCLMHLKPCCSDCSAFCQKTLIVGETWRDTDSVVTISAATVKSGDFSNFRHIGFADICFNFVATNFAFCNTSSFSTHAMYPYSVIWMTGIRELYVNECHIH